MKDTVFVDTQQGVSDLVDWILLQDTWLGDIQPPLYIDAEGERLGRDGKLSLFTILVYPSQFLARPHIIDIHNLGNLAFSTVGGSGKSLKDILESSRFIKVFFDVRNDSDALHFHYNIKLDGVRDVQLMENARRRTTNSRKFLSGLAKCIEESLYGPERDQWRRSKEKGEKLWNPQKGGSYSVLNIRPLPAELIEYCIGDVQHLPTLFEKYKCGTDRWKGLVVKESHNRVLTSQTARYSPHGTDRALSPWTPDQNRMLDTWAEVNPQKDYFGHSEDNGTDDPWDDPWDRRWNKEDEWDDGCDNDYEDWTRADWEGPPS
ncbi:hypothetical protein BFJ72_g14951 [Fusarium proliferatum]|uniref:3'-5' exonuclease domain-containing protein n=1 Tax=Gibberella intermedia TaxID=948311 RepID=A0A420RV50_GIBIN|nr:hypothetical protein FPRO03_14023 [Fusarium proliferatum]RKL20929.1 hypothetical protein BFJ72_g14951 [Fusarium proliferatum]